MLSVLVLAAVLAIAFSLATIVFVEIRVSGDVLRTEPAMYGTFGVTEEALFQYKRFIDPDPTVLDVPHCLPVSLNVCSINHVTLTMPGTQPIQYDSSPRVESIARHTKVSLPMYLVNDFTRQYTYVKVELLQIGSGAQLKVNLVKTDDTGHVTDPVLTDTYISEGGTPFSYSAFDTTGQYDLILDNSANNVDVTASITSTRTGGATPAGLPYTGEEVLRIMADYLGLTRTYQVRIPIP